MIHLTCSPEVEAIVAYGASTGVTMKVTSTLRPGAVTAAGNLSLHGAGLAVDYAARAPSWDSEELADIFHAFLPVEKHLAELIYAGPQVAFNIKDGRRVGRYAQGIHHNHVHVAVRAGVFLDRLVPTFLPDTIIEQAPDDDEREDMADPVDALAAPDGGCWVLTRDGGVRAYKGAPFWGSYPGLAPEDRAEPEGAPRVFDSIEAAGAGYLIHATDGATYRFG